MSQDKKPVGIEGLALLPGRGFRKQSQTTTKKKKMCACKIPSFVFVACRCIRFYFFPCTHSVVSAYVAPEPLKWPAEESSPYIPRTDWQNRSESWSLEFPSTNRAKKKKKNTNSPFGSCHSFPLVKTFCGVPSVQLITRSAWLLSKSVPADIRTEKREKSDHTEFKRYSSLLITSNLSLVYNGWLKSISDVCNPRSTIISNHYSNVDNTK